MTGELSKKKVIVTSIVSSLLLGAGVVSGYFQYSMGAINRAQDNSVQEETFEQDDEELLKNVEKESEDLNWKDMGYDAASMKGVTNILLCGEEAIGERNVSRGRTDCIMIATINRNQKSLKLTSLMRDIYVQIPGYSNNKLNSAYNTGGIPLLMKTVETNFGIDLDGYVLINFDGFEKIIDLLGGVEIELSQQEAHYLNTTNYISKKKYRHVKAGKNLMNGNQALGYSRVRYVRTPNGLANDYGRNYRQKTVLTQVFERYKDTTPVDIIKIFPSVMQLISTDISKTQLIKYTASALSMKGNGIATYRLPVDNYFKDARIRNMLVLYITDMAMTRSILHEYIFGTKLDISSAGTNYINEPLATQAPVTARPVITAKPTVKPTVKPTATPKAVYTIPPAQNDWQTNYTDLDGDGFDDNTGEEIPNNGNWTPPTTAPTAAPTARPNVTAKPTMKPTAKPVQTPKPVATPTEEPVYTQEPSQITEPTPEVTIDPSNQINE